MSCDLSDVGEDLPWCDWSWTRSGWGLLLPSLRSPLPSVGFVPCKQDIVLLKDQKASLRFKLPGSS